MRKIILILMSLVLGCQVAAGADYTAKPTVSILLNVTNHSNYYYGNDLGYLYLFAQSLEGRVGDLGNSLIQPEDATVDYLLQTISTSDVNKVCMLTITTIKGSAIATIKNLPSWNSCTIQGDPNSYNFTFTIN